MIWAEPARKTSSADMFFFCGIMLEVWATLSGRFSVPNSKVVMTNISCARRLQVVAVMAAAPSNSARKSRAAMQSWACSPTVSNPSHRAVASRSMGKEVPAMAPAPSGDMLMRARHSVSRAKSRSNAWAKPARK